MEIQASFLRWLEYRQIIFTDTADSTTDMTESVYCVVYFYSLIHYSMSTARAIGSLIIEMDVLSGQL